MQRDFHPTTAELVIEAVEAVYVFGQEANSQYVAAFTDQPTNQAEDALEMATDLKLLTHGPSNGYLPDSPLCRYTVSPHVEQKAAIVRIILDSYQPFLTFKERLIATNNPAIAAEQTKAILDINAHRTDIKDTMISLGSYGQLLITEGGGSYRLNEPDPLDPLKSIAQACNDTDGAERTIRNHLGSKASFAVSSDEVIQPLADGLWKAKGGDSSGAIQQAGNAVESFLDQLGKQVGANLVKANGLNAKATRISQNGSLPSKLLNISKYLGHIRNAADHGIDSDIGMSWTITNNVGLEYVFVACSFIASAVHWNSENSARL